MRRRIIIIFSIITACMVAGSAIGWIFYDRIIALLPQQLQSIALLQQEPNSPASRVPTTRSRSTIVSPQTTGPDDPQTITDSAPSEQAVEVPALEIGFDTVRADTSGLLVAGRAPAKSIVDIIVNKKIIGKTIANDDGRFVYLDDNPLPLGEHQIKIGITDSSDRQLAFNDYVILLVEHDALASRQRRRTTAVAIEDIRSRLLQMERDSGSGDFTIDIIDYNNRGNLYLAGLFKKRKHGTIVVYINDQLVASQASAIAERVGYWEVHTYNEIPPGKVVVRIDLIVRASVVARRKVAFTRTDKVLLTPDLKRVVIRKGNTLWQIADFVLGSGRRYVVIFKNNRDQIDDPNLIYPGQILDLKGRKL